MSRGTFVFTSESVTEGHPDKLCDLMSDAIVGCYLRLDPLAQVSVECAVSTGIVFVSVKQQSTESVDVPRIVRDAIASVGYSGADFNPADCTVMVSMAEIDHGQRLVCQEDEMTEAQISGVVASTPVTVFGYACDHTDELMPLPIHLAHKLARGLRNCQRDGSLPWLSPDGGAQVAVEFERGRPMRIHGVGIVAAQLDGGPPIGEMRSSLLDNVVDPAFDGAALAPDHDSWIYVNPEGPVVGGGPAKHAGLTGRKTHVDTYGEYARNSSSALSGKDPSRVDRVGAYAARHAAKCVVAAGLATEAEVTLSYTPGMSKPVSVQVDTSGTGRVEDDLITERVRDVFDFRPAAIVRRFGLRTIALDRTDGYFRNLAAFGHMGRVDLDAPWERTEEAAQLT